MKTLVSQKKPPILTTKIFRLNSVFHELKQEIQSLKQKVWFRTKFSSNENKNNIENIELHFSLLQQGNNFLITDKSKSENNW